MSRSLAPALVTAEDVVMHDMENRPVREADRQKKPRLVCLITPRWR